MKHPTAARDRLAEYYAIWPTSRGHETYFQLEKLGIKHDCETKEVQPLRWDNTSMVVIGHTHTYEAAQEIFNMLRSKLASLGLKATHHSINHVTGQIEYGLESPSGCALSFRSSLDIVRFINQVAGLFGRDPVAVGSLRKSIVTREVFVQVAGAPHGWVDEAEWLATSAALVPRQQEEI